MNDDRQGRPGGPTEEQIIEAVDKSGLLLEQKVGDFLEKRGWEVEYSWEYTDPDEGKSRELDMVAFLPEEEDPQLDYRLRFRLFIECKQRRNPVVVLTRPMTTLDKQAWELDVGAQPSEVRVTEYTAGDLPNRPHTFNTSIARYLGLVQEAHHLYRSLRKGVQLCSLVRNNEWEIRPGLKSAIAVPLAKACAFYSKRFKDTVMDQPVFEDSWPCMFDVRLTIGVINSELYSLTYTGGGAELSREDTIPMLGFYRSAALSTRWIIDLVDFTALQSFHDDVLQTSIARIRKALRELVQGIRLGGWPIDAQHFPGRLPWRRN